MKQGLDAWKGLWGTKSTVTTQMMYFIRRFTGASITHLTWHKQTHHWTHKDYLLHPSPALAHCKAPPGWPGTGGGRGAPQARGEAEGLPWTLGNPRPAALILLQAPIKIKGISTCLFSPSINHKSISLLPCTFYLTHFTILIPQKRETPLCGSCRTTESQLWLVP